MNHCKDDEYDSENFLLNLNEKFEFEKKVDLLKNRKLVEDEELNLNLTTSSQPLADRERESREISR